MSLPAISRTQNSNSGTVSVNPSGRVLNGDPQSSSQFGDRKADKRGSLTHAGRQIGVTYNRSAMSASSESSHGIAALIAASRQQVKMNSPSPIPPSGAQMNSLLTRHPSRSPYVSPPIVISRSDSEIGANSSGSERGSSQFNSPNISPVASPILRGMAPAAGSPDPSANWRALPSSRPSSRIQFSQNRQQRSEVLGLQNATSNPPSPKNLVSAARPTKNHAHLLVDFNTRDACMAGALERPRPDQNPSLQGTTPAVSSHTFVHRAAVPVVLGSRDSSSNLPSPRSNGSAEQTNRADVHRLVEFSTRTVCQVAPSEQPAQQEQDMSADQWGRLLKGYRAFALGRESGFTAREQV